MLQQQPVPCSSCRWVASRSSLDMASNIQHCCGSQSCLQPEHGQRCQHRLLGPHTRRECTTGVHQSMQFWHPAGSCRFSGSAKAICTRMGGAILSCEVIVQDSSSTEIHLGSYSSQGALMPPVAIGTKTNRRISAVIVPSCAASCRMARVARSIAASRASGRREARRGKTCCLFMTVHKFQQAVRYNWYHALEDDSTVCRTKLCLYEAVLVYNADSSFAHV
jgi:hypothetical protein